jgi:diacylglycerol kinase family enzyme
MDVGYLGDRHFLNIAGIGFDAAVGTAFNRRNKRGLRGYVRQLFTSIWRYRPERYRLDVDGTESEGERFLIAFANGREYGNHMVLAPAADPGDGWLDVVTVGPGGPIRQLWRARRLAFGHGRPAEGVAWGRCQAARVSGDRLVCHVDGEPFETSGTLDVRIVRGAIGVCGAPGR